MENKIMFITVVALALIGVSQIQSHSITPFANNLIIGTHRPGSVLVYSQQVNVAGIANQIVSRNVFYNGSRNITLIQALDQNTNRTGGFAQVTTGGLYQRSVTINLRASAVGRGINFNVNIWGL